MSKRASNPIWSGAALFGALLLSGCAIYHRKPLPMTPDLMRSPALTVPVDKLDLPGLKPHPIPTNGLDETAIVTLAVLNDPDLKAARLQAGVADAQVLEAGLLPDPQVSGGLSQSPEHTGYSIGLGEDIQALITRGAAKAAAKARARQVRLDILWQEWQVAGQARETFIQLRADQRLLALLEPFQKLLAGICGKDQAALARNDVTIGAASSDLRSLAGVEANLRQTQLDANQGRHVLAALLGLEPDAPVPLAGAGRDHLLTQAQFGAALAALPRRRADLLALQAGYESQEQSLREAILAQFPAISAGVQQARSAEEGVHSIGFTVNVTLPLFNRNRGRIAIQRATRALLYQTWQARLDQAASQADQLWRASRIMAARLHDLEIHASDTKTGISAADRDYRAGNLSASEYLALVSDWQAEQMQEIQLRASLEQAEAAVRTILGLPFEP
ncbi:MAG: TolC family protein [Verrucomicrobia bacterium]|nr:TolC family protein [Verrucomicrobiota bacterium]MDE3099949.1 TolC family protein [Verrucomicrobiota bacterium]